LLRWNWGKKRVAGAASSHRGKDREESLLWLNLALPFLCYSRHFNLRAFALAVPLSSFFLGSFRHLDMSFSASLFLSAVHLTPFPCPFLDPLFFKKIDILPCLPNLSAM
jgi:hypothetical protein